MKHLNPISHADYFKVLASTRSAQAAVMTLRKGQSSSDKPENEHPASEQWLYVIAGKGRARVGRQTIAIKQGSLLLIEKGEPHRITNPHAGALVTLNFYAPPAYTPAGELRDEV